MSQIQSTPNNEKELEKSIFLNQLLSLILHEIESIIEVQKAKFIIINLMEKLQPDSFSPKSFINAMLAFKQDYPERAIDMIQSALKFKDIAGFVADFLENPSLSLTKEQISEIEQGLKQLIFEIPISPKTISTGKGELLRKKLLEIQEQALTSPEIAFDEIQKLLKNTKLTLSGEDIYLSQEEIDYVRENLEQMAQLIKTPTESEVSQISEKTEEALKTA